MRAPGSGVSGWGSGTETGFGSHTNGDVPDGGFSNGGQSDGAADSGVWSGPQQPADPNGPLLAIVIDDWGYGWQAAADFWHLIGRLVAVLPLFAAFPSPGKRSSQPGGMR